MTSPPSTLETRITTQESKNGNQRTQPDACIEKAYLRGVTAHSDLGIALDVFAAHLKSIIAKELGATPAQDSANRLIAGLNAEDLYLAAACAHNSEPAWNQFFALYDDHIRNVAHGICSTRQEARDLSSSMLGHLFFRDGHGQSRIASYQGRGSLRTWLATIIKYQVINQSQLKSSEAVSLDSLRHVACAKSAGKLEAAVLRSRYSEAISDSFKTAAEQLNEREKLVLVLRFGDEMKGAEIAQLLDVHPAQITRTIKQAQRKFRTAVLARLDTHHELGAQAIEECIALVLAAPETSIVRSIRTVEPRSFAAQFVAANAA